MVTKEQRDDHEEERQQHRAFDGHDRCRRPAREVDVRRAGRDRHFEPQPVDRDDDDQLRERKPRDQRSAPVREQAAEPSAQERRQQDEVGEVRQEPDVRRHPADERDLEEEDQERRRGTASRIGNCEPPSSRSSPRIDISACFACSAVERSEYFTPELFKRRVGQPFHSSTNMLPWYCRSAIPIFVVQNPLAVRSRKLLKNATAWLRPGSGFGGVGDLVEDLPPLRVRCVQRSACRRDPSTADRAAPGRRASRPAAAAGRSS